MAAERLTTITEAWIRERLQLKLPHLGDVRSLSLPGTYEEKIRHLGTALRNFVRLKSVDLSCNGLTSVEGLLHLKMLERLNLYYNCISSVKEVKGLCKLPALRELDLRLNPLTKNDPHYRLYLVHAMPNLRKLDDCPVRDTERKAAIMQFSSDLLPHQKSHLLIQAPDHRSSDPRLASVDRLTKRLSFADNSDDIVLNFGAESSRLQQETEEAESKSVSETESCSSSLKQEPVKSILRSTQKNYGYTQSKVPQTKVSSHKKNSTSLKGVEGPRVTFNPQVEKRRPDSGRHKHKDPGKRPAKGHFTPNPDQGHQQHDTPLMNIRPPSPRSPGMTLSDPSNPILHPPRLSYSSRTAGGSGGSGLPQKTHHQKRQGSYRKPLEMLLNLVDKHWKGERSLHHNSDFLSKAVQILSMMEDDISSREDEIRTMKGEVEGLKRQAEVRQEEHKIQVHDLSVQLEDAQGSASKLNEQLKIVLEENVNLQKQLIKLEQQYLKSMMKTSPVTQIKEAQTEVDELRREIEGLRQKVHEAEKVKDLAHMLQESHRSLVATNERLLGELGASGEL